MAHANPDSDQVELRGPGPLDLDLFLGIDPSGCARTLADTFIYADGPRIGNGSSAKSICAAGLLMAVTVPEPNGPA